MTISKPWIVGFLLLLTVSLAGNVFTGGLMLGRQIFQGEAPGIGQVVRAFFKTVPEEARPVVRRHLRAHAREILQRVQDIRRAREKVADVLSGTQVNEAALSVAFAGVRESTTALQKLIHEALIGAIEELPPEVRAQWQERWRAGVLPMLK